MVDIFRPQCKNINSNNKNDDNNDYNNDDANNNDDNKNDDSCTINKIKGHSQNGYLV